MKTIVSILTILTLSIGSVGMSDNELCSSLTEEVKIDYEGRIRRVLESEEIDPYTIELIVAQSKYESGNYKNTLTPYNNVFARHYSKKDTFALSAGARAEGHSRFAKYPNVESATLSQLWYFRKKNYSFRWKSPYQFALELKQKHYYEADIMVYTKGLIRHMRENKTKN
jgi:hypothetical protein